MSDTHIHYKYKDKIQPDVKQGEIHCDRGVFKGYLDMYNGENILTKEKRFWHCDLHAIGNKQCQLFLEDICNFWNSEKCGYAWEYADKGKVWHEFMKQQDIVEITFCSY